MCFDLKSGHTKIDHLVSRGFSKIVSIAIGNLLKITLLQKDDGIVAITGDGLAPEFPLALDKIQQITEGTDYG